MPKIIKKHSKTALVLGLILALIAMYELIPLVKAAELTYESDTLSDSRPSEISKHTVIFKATTAVPLSGHVIIDLPDAFVTPAMDYTDVAIYFDADNPPITECVMAAACDATKCCATITEATDLIDITLKSGAGITAGHYVKVVIGDGAAGGWEDITNSIAGVQTITLTTQTAAAATIDTGTLKVAVISGVAVTATVAETLTFTIAAVGSSQSVNGATTTVATTDGVSVPLGALSVSANTIAAHDLAVTTNATNGYTTTTQYTQKLRIDASNDIDDHSGSNASPSTFSGAATEAFGYTTNDATLGTGTPARFTSSGGNKWAAFTTSPLEVAYSAGPVTAEATRIGYQAGISATTSAGSYSTTVIYICTPIY